VPPVERSELPSYQDLIYPTLVAVDLLGGSAQGSQVTTQLLDGIGPTEEQIALQYENRPKSILIDRIEWARSYAKLGGALESPRRGLYILTPLGKEIVGLPEAEGKSRARELDREVRRQRVRSRSEPGETEAGEIEAQPPDVQEEDTTWKETLLDRLHRLTPEGFEEFALYLLRSFGLVLKRVGGSGDEGIDGIGLAPISSVLSSRVAVQAKRYDPASPVGRDVVALFQRDARAAGAERAVLVTLGRFTEAARKAATTETPTVDLIDGDRLCELALEQGIGITMAPQVVEPWFDRFDANR